MYVYASTIVLICVGIFDIGAAWRDNRRAVHNSKLSVFCNVDEIYTVCECVRGYAAILEADALDAPSAYETRTRFILINFSIGMHYVYQESKLREKNPSAFIIGSCYWSRHRLICSHKLIDQLHTHTVYNAEIVRTVHTHTTAYECDH